MLTANKIYDREKRGPSERIVTKRTVFSSLCLQHTLPDRCKDLSLVSFQTKHSGEVSHSISSQLQRHACRSLASEQLLCSEPICEQVVAYLTRWVCSGYCFCKEKAIGHDAAMPLICMVLPVRIGMLKHSRPRKYWRGFSTLTNFQSTLLKEVIRAFIITDGFSWVVVEYI